MHLNIFKHAILQTRYPQLLSLDGLWLSMTPFFSRLSSDGKRFVSLGPMGRHPETRTQMGASPSDTGSLMSRNMASVCGTSAGSAVQREKKDE